MSNSAEECWKSLITRYGAPLEIDRLDDDTLKLAIDERRALVTERISDGCGGGDVYFHRAKMGSYKRAIIVFPRPCEITDEEIAALDHPNPWESDVDIHSFTCEILKLGSWRTLIARYGSPLYEDRLDEDTLKLAIDERRAIKVISRRDGFGSGEVRVERAQVGDAINGYIERYRFEKHKRYYFCIVFPKPCQITDADISSLQESGYAWEWYDEFLKEIDGILTITECWRKLINLYGAPLESESLDNDSLKLAIAERRALRLIKQIATVTCRHGHVYLERAEVGNTIKGYTTNNVSDSLICPYISIVFSRPCEITDEEITILKKGSIECWNGCEFTSPNCTCYQAILSMLAAKHCFY